MCKLVEIDVIGFWKRFNLLFEEFFFNVVNESKVFHVYYNNIGWNKHFKCVIIIK